MGLALHTVHASVFKGCHKRQHLFLQDHKQENGRNAKNMIYGAKVTTAVIKQMEIWQEFFRENPKGYFLQYCHSRGAADVRNGLMHTPQWMRERIAVVAIAPGCFIETGLCLSAIHYCSTKDMVPYVDFRGRPMCEKNTVVLKPHEGASFLDHGFQSKTYEGVIKYQFDKFYERYAQK